VGDWALVLLMVKTWLLHTSLVMENLPLDDAEVGTGQANPVGCCRYCLQGRAAHVLHGECVGAHKVGHRDIEAVLGTAPNRAVPFPGC